MQNFGRWLIEPVLCLATLDLPWVTLLLRVKGVNLTRGLPFQLLFFLVILSPVDHKRIEFHVNLVDFGLRGCHEAALRVDEAEGSIVRFAAFLLLVNDSICRGAGLQVVLDVDIVYEVQKHGEVFKGYALC